MQPACLGSLHCFWFNFTLVIINDKDPKTGGYWYSYETAKKPTYTDSKNGCDKYEKRGQFTLPRLNIRLNGNVFDLLINHKEDTHYDRQWQ